MTGSDKQIKWAEDIKDAALAKAKIMMMESTATSEKAPNLDDMSAIYCEYTQSRGYRVLNALGRKQLEAMTLAANAKASKTDAKWWIDLRHPMEVLRALAADAKAIAETL